MGALGFDLFCWPKSKVLGCLGEVFGVLEAGFGDPRTSFELFGSSWEGPVDVVWPIKKVCGVFVGN